jgi:hypothetical protein
MLPYVSLIQVSIVLAILVIASVVYLYFRDRQMIGGLKDFLREGKYKLRVQPPLKAPFIYEQQIKVTSYDGQIKEGMPYTLILGLRTTGTGKDSITYQYVAFYFPAQVSLSDKWLDGWKHKVAERGDNWAAKSGVEKVEKNWGSKGIPDNFPIRAARMDGGTILAWNGLHTREHLEARINDVLASM